MKTKTGLLALGLFTVAGMVTISCGGSSDESSSTTAGTAGKGGSGSATAGTSSSAAGDNGTTAGTSSGGTSSGTAGNASTAGNSTGGNGTAGTNNNTAAADNNQGGANDIPGAGGAAANNPPGCPATMPADGAMCMQMQGMQLSCDYGTMACRCLRTNGGDTRSWRCFDTIGAGGAGPGGFGQATCPAKAKTGNDCTNGPGTCPGQRCFCTQENKIVCF